MPNDIIIEDVHHRHQTAANVLDDAVTHGTATLVAGTVDVPTAAVTADSEIFVSRVTLGGTAGHIAVSAREAGVDFTILSSSATETSTVSWAIIEPS